MHKLITLSRQLTRSPAFFQVTPITAVALRPFFNYGRKPPEPEEFDVNTDYYKALGVSKTASQKEIKNMYYKLCYEYHPDHSGGMHQEKFKEINAAYEVLQNEDKRKRYDQAREGTYGGSSQSQQ